MELYNNENDQVDALKRFFAENGKALAVGVILGVGALVGWRYWTSHQLDTARARLWHMKMRFPRSNRINQKR